MSEAVQHYQFIKTFFQEYGCPIVEDNNGRLVIQLTDEMDEALMNRPFYWHYIKKMGRQGDPMSLTLITNPALREEKGEYIHSGAPRLRQFYQYLLENNKYTKLYETVDHSPVHAPMIPWLVVNVKVHYFGKQKKDETHSVGLNLIHGTMLSPAMEKIESIKFEPTISDYTFPMTPLIKVASGYRRILRFIEDHIEAQDKTWVQETLLAREKERKLIEAFFTDKDNEAERRQLEKEMDDLMGRFTPRVTIEVINGGMFYLTQETANTMISH